MVKAENNVIYGLWWPLSNTVHHKFMFDSQDIIHHLHLPDYSTKYVAGAFTSHLSCFYDFYVKHQMTSLESSIAVQYGKLGHYCKTSSISPTKSQNLNVSCLLLQWSLPNLWSQVLSWEWRCSWMLQLHLNYHQFNCLLRCDLYQRFYGISGVACCLS